MLSGISRGEYSEYMVQRALETLMAKPKYDLLGIRRKIKGFVHSAKYSLNDHRGIDFLVKLDDGKEIPIQVKSSIGCCKAFRKKCARLGIFIPIVVVGEMEKIRTIAKKIARCIAIAYDYSRTGITDLIEYGRSSSRIARRILRERPTHRPQRFAMVH